MPTEIRLPKLGLTMDEGTIVEWKKNVGDNVNEGDVLFEVETDKVTMEVESPSAGVLRAIVAEEGTTLPVGELVAIFTEPGEELDESKVAALKQGGGSAASGTKTTGGRGLSVGGPAAGGKRPASAGGVRASPAAKRLARDHSIDLANVTGSGPGGRIVEADIQKAISGGGAAAPAGEIHPLTAIQRTTGKRLTESFTTVPHFYLTVEARADALTALRQKELPTIETAAGVRLAYNDLIVHLIAQALTRHPLANAAWHGGEVHLNSDINIGVAMANPQGLVVPIIKNADALSLVDLVRSRADLEERAKTNKLGRDDLTGGSFTLTNLGGWGIDSFSPIINPPQAVIVAVGSIRDRVVAIDGEVAVRPTMFMTIAADHRVLDGAAAAEFLKDLKESIETAAVS